jgi:hypothetical protein
MPLLVFEIHLSQDLKLINQYTKLIHPHTSSKWELILILQSSDAAIVEKRLANAQHHFTDEPQQN